MAFGGVAQLIAAGATVTLAGITAWMAKRTHDVASKTEDSVEVARRSLAATFRPLLVPVVNRDPSPAFVLRGFDDDEGNEVSVSIVLEAQPRCWIRRDERTIERFFVIVPVRNVGPGPAAFGELSTGATFTPWFPGAKQLNGRISSPVVASDDVADIVFYGVPADFTRMFDRTGLETDRRATVEITYFDISRAKPTVTRLALGLTEESFLQVIDALIEP